MQENGTLHPPNHLSYEALVAKYNRLGPRYTSYPPLPLWKGLPPFMHWKESLQRSLCKSSKVDVYIHLPFCRELCAYCGCHRFIDRQSEDKTSYIELLLKEWELYRSHFGALEIGTLHLGGGTPTFFSPQQLKALLAGLPLQKLSIGAVELDPRTLQREHLALFKQYRLERLSMGIQDFDPGVQKAIRRDQSFELVEGWVREVRKLAFECLNFDLIYGLPRQTWPGMEKTLEKVTLLNPDSLAIYSYAHIPWKVKNQNTINPNELPDARSKFDLAQNIKAFLNLHGYLEIGFDHYARKDHFLARALQEKKLKRSFMGYTDEKNEVLIGLGVSSIGQSESMYFQNHKEINNYRDNLIEGTFPLIHGHELSDLDKQYGKLISEILCHGKWKRNEIQVDDQTMAALNEMQSDGLLTLSEEENEYQATNLGRPFLRNMAMLYDPYMKVGNQAQQFGQTIS